jgi:hypothetical protein
MAKKEDDEELKAGEEGDAVKDDADQDAAEEPSAEKATAEAEARVVAEAAAKQSDDPDEEEMEAEGVQAKPTAGEEAHAETSAPGAVVEEGPEPPLERDTPKLKIITGAYVATILLVVVCVIATREIFMQTIGAELKRKVREPVAKELTELRTLEQDRLTNYQWVDQGKGVVRMPTDRAEAIVLTRYAQMPIEPEPTDEIDDEPPPPEPKGEGGGDGAGGGDPAGAGGGDAGGEEKKDGEEKKGDEKKPEEKKGDEKKPEEKKPEKKGAAPAPTGQQQPAGDPY